MTEANYGARQPNDTAYIKHFVYGTPANLWKIKEYIKTDGTKETVLTPSSSKFESLYIQGDLFVDGSIINPSDINIKNSVTPLNSKITDKLMRLEPMSYEFKDDPTKHTHYGFIANEFENEYPELVHSKPDAKYSKIKSINYMEIIPLLVSKIQQMQREIDELKGK